MSRNVVVGLIGVFLVLDLNSSAVVAVAVAERR